MELDELRQRLPAFCEEMVGEGAILDEVWRMPGHAGFSYGFSVRLPDGVTDRWFLRLPPPGVRLEGTADVLRQVATLQALDGTGVPHCSVRWWGRDERWFGRPWFVVPVLEGDVVRLEEDGWTRELEEADRWGMARQAMQALAGLHGVAPDRATIDSAPYLGEALEPEADVERWDRFVAKAADPHRLELVPEVRRLLLDGAPAAPPMGIFHGDFQWGNLFFSTAASDAGRLLAVIDFELVGVGPVLNDVGWIATFNDPEAWGDNREVGAWMPHADELISMYAEADGPAPADMPWYRALAAYKFAIISGFNLMLHRRGKRHDPLWEDSRHSIEPLLRRARALLS